MFMTYIRIAQQNVTLMLLLVFISSKRAIKVSFGGMIICIHILWRSYLKSSLPSLIWISIMTISMCYFIVSICCHNSGIATPLVYIRDIQQVNSVVKDNDKRTEFLIDGNGFSNSRPWDRIYRKRMIEIMASLHSWTYGGVTLYHSCIHWWCS